jgi:hypothetical protein
MVVTKVRKIGEWNLSLYHPFPGQAEQAFYALATPLLTPIKPEGKP